MAGLGQIRVRYESSSFRKPLGTSKQFLAPIFNGNIRFLFCVKLLCESRACLKISRRSYFLLLCAMSPQNLRFLFCICFYIRVPTTTQYRYPLHVENFLVVALFRLIFFVSKVSVLFKLKLFLISYVIVFIEYKGNRVILLRYLKF
jgi:hypothetical protein